MKKCCCCDDSDPKGPYKLEPQTKAVYICTCGRSKNKPFCDGSHLKPGSCCHEDKK